MVFQSDSRLVDLVKILCGLMIFGGIMIALYAYAYHKSYNSAKYNFTDSNTGQVIKISPDNNDVDKELSDAKFVSYDYITGTIVLEKDNGIRLEYVVDDNFIFGPTLHVTGVTDDKSVLQGINLDVTKKFLNYLVKHGIFDSVDFVSYSSDTDTVTYRSGVKTYHVKLD
jgi:hypothetical protein